MDELDCRTFVVVVAESHSLSLDIEAQWTKFVSEFLPEMMRL